MKISNSNNISFKAVYYEGHYKGKKSKDGIHFEIKNERPDVYLTDKQQSVTREIEKMLDDTLVNYTYKDGYKMKTYLIWALDDKNTDIYFRYPKPNVVEASLVKWNTGSWGDEYSYTPYNAKGNKRVKMEFSLNITPSINKIQKETTKFLADCKAYLTDDNNPKNKKIEDKLDAVC